MTGDEVVVLIWHGSEEPLVELANHVSTGLAEALSHGSATRVRQLTVEGNAVDLGAIPKGAVVFPVAVGAANSGWLQHQLEAAGLAFAGSGGSACTAGYDLCVLRAMLDRAGIAVPPYLVCKRGGDLQATAERAVRSFPLGCWVLPSVGDTMRPCHGPNNAADVMASLEKVLATSATAVIQANRTGGRTFSLAYLRDGTRVVLLPTVEVVDGENFTQDFKMYSPRDTAYDCPASIDERLCRALDRIGRATHSLLGCVISRIDAHLDDEDFLTISSVEAAPLLLPGGLFARAAAGSGLSFVELSRHLVDDARHHRARAK